MKLLLTTTCLLMAIAPIASAATNPPPAVAGTNAAPVAMTVSVGGVSIKMPLPNAEFVEVGYDNREFMEVMTPAQNRLICAYVLTNELARLSKRDEDLQMSRYILVQVPRRGESMDCSAANFEEVVSGAKEAFGDKSGTGVDSIFKEAQDEIDRRLKSLDVEGGISLGKPVQLGSLFTMKDAYSFGMIMPVTVDGKTVKMGCGGILLRVKSRLLFVYVYSEYKDEKTIHYLGQVAEKWAKDILSANAD
jgi:hypothetical protein